MLADGINYLPIDCLPIGCDSLASLRLFAPSSPLTMAGLAPHQRRSSRRRSRPQRLLASSAPPDSGSELWDPAAELGSLEAGSEVSSSRPPRKPPYVLPSTRPPLTRVRRTRTRRSVVRSLRTGDRSRFSPLWRTLGLSLALGLGVGTLGHLLNRPPQPPRDPAGIPEGLALSTLAPLELDRSLFQDQRQLDLEHELQALLEVPGLTPHLMTLDLDTGAYVDLRGSEPVQAASVIKIPILVAFLQAVDRGEVRLDERLVLDSRLAGGGSGELQVRPYGSEVDALTAATLMITVSDNFATNLIIDRLGGKEALNQIFANWGLEQTQISWLLPDLEGTNTVSPADIVSLLARVEAGEMLSLRSRDRFFEMMRGVQNRLLLPAGLGEGASIAHKTGNIRSVLGDAGIIDMPNGDRYLVAVLLRREVANDPRANDLLPQASRVIYDYWLRFGAAKWAAEQAQETESTQATPEETSGSPPS